MKKPNNINIYSYHSSLSCLLAIVTFLPLFSLPKNSNAATIKYSSNNLLSENIDLKVDRDYHEENPVKEYAQALDNNDIIDRYKKNSLQKPNNNNSNPKNISKQPVEATKNLTQKSSGRNNLNPLPASKNNLTEQCEQYSPIGKVAQERKSSVYIVPKADLSSIFKGVYDYESNPECAEPEISGSNSTSSGTKSELIAQSMLEELDILNYSKIGTKVFTPKEYIKPLAERTVNDRPNAILNSKTANSSINIVQTLGNFPQNSSVSNTTYTASNDRSKGVQVYGNSIITTPTTPITTSTANSSSTARSAIEATLPMSGTDKQVQENLAKQREKNQEQQKKIIEKIQEQIEEKEKIDKKRQEEILKKRQELAKKQMTKQKEQMDKIQQLAHQ